MKFRVLFFLFLLPLFSIAQNEECPIVRRPETPAVFGHSNQQIQIYFEKELKENLSDEKSTGIYAVTINCDGKVKMVNTVKSSFTEETGTLIVSKIQAMKWTAAMNKGNTVGTALYLVITNDGKRIRVKLY